MTMLPMTLMVMRQTDNDAIDHAGMTMPMMTMTMPMMTMLTTITMLTCQ